MDKLLIKRGQEIGKINPRALYALVTCPVCNKQRIKYFEARIAKLEVQAEAQTKQIRLLKWQLGQRECKTI